ncbi:hypothetical protein F4560_008466 [Saccharothrix ecbatanensis]|uniref:Uncharacterized protein n=1 Tax=Saccharothrix ecbatanensis TaxID=1105145 RepID=A0A7W9HUI3_9PSEU|nr:hypothetical protein [Saccharothrix ecbatanensis]MBB5808698.1 hypothetical protein [Saccharothrix ecbatanensis]
MGLVACLALGWAIVGFGRALPTAYHPINALVWIAGCGSMFAVFLSSVSLLAARSYVRGEYLDVNGARVARRALAGGWTGAVIVAVIAWFLLVMTVTSGSRQVGFTSGVWAYLFLLAAPSVAAGVLFFLGRALFRLPIAPTPRPQWRG